MKVIELENPINQTQCKYLEFLAYLSQFRTSLPIVIIGFLDTKGYFSNEDQPNHKAVVSDILKLWTKDKGLDQALIGAHGKPFLDAMSFNYSTSGNWLGLVVAKPSTSLGIDLESKELLYKKYPQTREDRIQSIIERFYTLDENTYLQQLREQQGFNSWRDCFFRYWTMKEAFVKAIGESIGSHSKELDISKSKNWCAEISLNRVDWYVKGVSQKSLFLGISMDSHFELEYIITNMK